jgi:hypothetical protein
VILSPDWTNGTNVLASYFLPAFWPIQTDSPRAYWNQYRPFDPQRTLFVITPEEYAAMPRNKFKNIQVVSTLPYPDGRAGFYFVRLTYIDDIQSVMAADQIQRNRLVEDRFDLDGSQSILRHSKLDMGKISYLFDGNPYTVVRTDRINPMILELEFPSPRSMRALMLRVGSAATSILVEAWTANADQAETLQINAPETVEVRDVTADLGGAIQVQKLRLTVTTLDEPADVNVHLWELGFH